MMGWLITSRINWTSNLAMLCTHSLPLNINPPRRASAVIVSQSTRSRIFVTFFHKMRPLFLDEKGNYCTSQFCYLLRSLVRYSNSRNLLFNSLTSFASFEKKKFVFKGVFFHLVHSRSDLVCLAVLLSGTSHHILCYRAHTNMRWKGTSENQVAVIVRHLSIRWRRKDSLK